MPTSAEASPKLDLVGVVEPALAEALMLAARAGRWEIVEQIAGELRQRRRAREGSSQANERSAPNTPTHFGKRTR